MSDGGHGPPAPSFWDSLLDRLQEFVEADQDAPELPQGHEDDPNHPYRETKITDKLTYRQTSQVQHPRMRRLVRWNLRFIVPSIGSARH